MNSFCNNAEKDVHGKYTSKSGLGDEFRVAPGTKLPGSKVAETLDRWDIQITSRGVGSPSARPGWFR
jgi:hypothetical protein